MSRRAGAFVRGALIVLTIVSAWILLASRPLGAADTEALEIASKTGVHPFAVELAVTDEQRARGLMFRKEVPEGYGMLFDFKRDQEVSMWMENTFVPLDMIFIRADGRIARIAQNTEPMSRNIIASGGPVRAVLEVAGGTTKKLGIVAGDKVGHPLFNGH